MTEPSLMSLPAPSEGETQRGETPSLLDELKGIQELLDRPPSREAFLAQLFELEMQIARDHHRQQIAEYELGLARQERRERQAACLGWLRVGLAYAIGALVVVAVAAAILAVVAGRINPVELLPPRV